nr:hypothetical protein [Tanacetum cinerariifolium]
GGGVFTVVVVTTAAQNLPRNVGVAEVFDFEMIEVVHAAVDRQIFRPPVGVALERDAAAWVDLTDPVRTAADRGLEAAAVGEVAVFPPVLREDRERRE